MKLTAFHQHIICQLYQDLQLLFTHTEIAEPLKSACLYALGIDIHQPSHQHTANSQQLQLGGKRVRPLLVASSFLTILHQSSPTLSDENLLNGMVRRAMMAVELLHAYSLVHDDLPCMDDDELRRGRPTCHMAFDEATALLAGDILQTLSFEVLVAQLPNMPQNDDTLTATLLQLFAPKARRMVSGQMLDLKGEYQQLTQSQLEQIHRDKTGALIEAAITMGGACANASQEQMLILSQFAKKIGLAFQVQDDILDATKTTEQLGKPSKSDEKLDKSTYVKLMGIENAKHYAHTLFTDAQHDLCLLLSTHDLQSQNQSNNELLTLVKWLWYREH